MIWGIIGPWLMIWFDLALHSGFAGCPMVLADRRIVQRGVESSPPPVRHRIVQSSTSRIQSSSRQKCFLIDSILTLGSSLQMGSIILSRILKDFCPFQILYDLWGSSNIPWKSPPPKKKKKKKKKKTKPNQREIIPQVLGLLSTCG